MDTQPKQKATNDVHTCIILYWTSLKGLFRNNNNCKKNYISTWYNYKHTNQMTGSLRRTWAQWMSKVNRGCTWFCWTMDQCGSIMWEGTAWTGQCQTLAGKWNIKTNPPPQPWYSTSQIHLAWMFPALHMHHLIVQQMYLVKWSQAKGRHRRKSQPLQ